MSDDPPLEELPPRTRRDWMPVTASVLYLVSLWAIGLLACVILFFFAIAILAA